MRRCFGFYDTHPTLMSAVAKNHFDNGGPSYNSETKLYRTNKEGGQGYFEEGTSMAFVTGADWFFFPRESRQILMSG